MADNKYLLNKIHKEGKVIEKEKAEEIAKKEGISLNNLYEFLSFYTLFSTKEKSKHIIRVCNGISCYLENKKIISKFKEYLKIKKDFIIEKTSCIGACALSPSIMIDSITFGNLKEDDIPFLIENFKKGKPEPLKIPLFAPYGKILLRNVYEINPLKIEEYIEREGYKALEIGFKKGKDYIIKEVKNSGLRGRGGAGFLTGLKWEFVKNEKDSPKFLICNADEGEPGTFKDRILIENDPHSIIEGMIIAGYAVGAEKGIIYIRGEYEVGFEILNHAIKEAKEKGFLGKNIFNNFSFDIEIIKGGGSYICGEETALIESIEGKRGEPRKKPPFPSSKGLYGKPTLINNVETFANIPLILLRGSSWYKKEGRILLSLSGDLKFKGVCEIPFGISLEEIIREIAGGVKEGNLKFLIIGGVSGNLLTPSNLNIKMDYDSFYQNNLSFGTGAIIGISDKRCSIDIAKNIIEFFREESCGKCIPCQRGTDESFRIIKAIQEGKGDEEDLALLFEIQKAMELSSFCPLGQTALKVIKEIIEEFKEEWEIHIKEKRCPFKVCGHE